ncbi:MAG: hypothetical protein RDU20_03650 [Desulfomonilaceae bacterium]|nr:hypothetical protein [Desulfomonilaceae bacterium]
MNGYRPKSNRELSEYQKRIEAIDNVILCVAEAERMCREVGMSLISESEIAKKIMELKNKKGTSSRSSCTRYYV